MLKLKMMLCVMMLPLMCRLHIKAVCCRSVREAIPAPPGVDNPDWQTPLNGIISPPQRLITMQKQLEGTQKYINEQCR